RLLVERGRALPVLEDTRLGTRRDALPEPLHTCRQERGFDELARELIELLEEETLPGVGEDAVRLTEDPVDAAEMVPEPAGGAIMARRLGIHERREEVRLVVTRTETQGGEHILSVPLERPEETELEGRGRMRVEVEHREEHVEGLLRAGRQAAEGAREVPARGPSPVLVEAVGGDGRLEELDHVVDVRGLPEERQRVGIPLLGDGVCAPAV